VLAGACLVGGFVGGGILEALGVDTTDTSAQTVLDVLILTGLLAIPIGIGIGILRYHLYDIDLVIKKTLVFGILVALLMALGLAAAIVLTNFVADPLYESPPLLLITGLALGLLATPLYRVSKRVADRIVYGGRATPYEVMSEFAERVGKSYSTEDVLPRMARLLGQATGASTAGVWLRVGPEFRRAAVWPEQGDDRPPVLGRGDELPAFEEDATIEVEHQGELLGALTVSMPPNDPMSPSKERIVRDLAAQAGLVLRNVRLIEELRASRQRLVAAQDEERRKIERNIHDGAQQQLVALAVKGRLAESQIGKDEERLRAILRELQADTNAALEDLRDLARGIYPPLLADRGLAEALQAQARKSPVPATVDPDGVGRYPREVESAVYFSVLEAMQNVAKYADASTATVRLRNGNGDLMFEVTDDGRGFDPDRTGYGTGLQGMADRLAAIGGALEVRSSPGAGTTVAGRLPLGRGAP
jgi:signal transduction histidine kinase